MARQLFKHHIAVEEYNDIQPVDVTNDPCEVQDAEHYMITGINELERQTQGMCELGDTIHALETYATTGQSVKPSTIAITNIATESLFRRLGIPHPQLMPAMEAFESVNSNATALNIALENMFETFKAFLARIKDYILKMWDGIVKFFSKATDESKRNQEQANELLKLVKQNSNDIAALARNVEHLKHQKESEKILKAVSNSLNATNGNTKKYFNSIVLTNAFALKPITGDQAIKFDDAKECLEKQIKISELVRKIIDEQTKVFNFHEFQQIGTVITRGTYIDLNNSTDELQNKINSRFNATFKGTTRINEGVLIGGHILESEMLNLGDNSRVKWNLKHTGIMNTSNKVSILTIDQIKEFLTRYILPVCAANSSLHELIGSIKQIKDITMYLVAQLNILLQSVNLGTTDVPYRKCQQLVMSANNTLATTIELAKILIKLNNMATKAGITYVTASIHESK